VLSASLLDGSTLDLLAPFQDVSAAPAVDVGGRQVVQVLVIAAVIVVVDEAGDGALEVTGQVVVSSRMRLFSERCQSSILPWVIGYE